MKLPVDTVIAREKISNYLLVPQPRNDKSGFLALAGFEASNPDALMTALAQLRSQLHVVSAGENAFGQYWTGDGHLAGPRGRLLVRTVWMTEHLSGRTKFVTLVPVRIFPS